MGIKKGGKKKIVDWEKAKYIYINSEMSLREVAEKLGITYKTLETRSVKEKWFNTKIINKEKVRANLGKKVNDVIEERSSILFEEWEKELKAANKITNIVLEILEDEGQFKKHLVPERGEFSTKVVEKKFTVYDAKRLKDLVSALTVANELKKSLTGFISEKDKKILELQRENLALSKEKAGIGLEDNEIGFIEMPSVNNEKYEAEKEEEIRRREAKKDDS